MGRASRGSLCCLVLVPCAVWLAGCSGGSTHRLPLYEAPIARTDYQTVRTTAYTDTEADHLAYTNHNALGGILHDAAPPLTPGVMVATAGAGRADANEVAQDIGGYRPVSNDLPASRSVDVPRAASVPRPMIAARPVDTVRPASVVPATRSARPASVETDDNPPWMKEYLRRKRQQRGDARPVYYLTSSMPIYGSAAADWSRWPVGTVFRIESTGQEYKVDDYGWALAGRNTIDLYKATRADMNAWGMRRVPIHVLRWGSREESLRLLRNHQGYKHIRRMVLELEGRDRAAADLE